VIFGSSGHASVVVDIIERAGAHRIVGLLDDTKPKGMIELGYPILGGCADLAEVIRLHNPAGFFVAIGDNWNRSVIAGKIRELAPALPAITAVHPSAQIARIAELRPGAAVMAGAVVNSNASIGAFCIVNTGATVDHDSYLVLARRWPVMSEWARIQRSACTRASQRRFLLDLTRWSVPGA
jgi:hypothetical protein